MSVTTSFVVSEFETAHKKRQKRTRMRAVVVAKQGQRREKAAKRLFKWREVQVETKNR